MTTSDHAKNQREKRFSEIYYEHPIDEHKSVWATPAVFAQPLYSPVSLRSAYCGRCRVMHHRSVYFALELLLKGRLTFCFNDEQRVVAANHVVLLHRNRLNGFVSAKNNSYSKLSLILSGMHLDSLLKTLNLDTCDILCPMDINEIKRRFTEIMTLQHAAQAGTERLLSEKVYSLLLYLGDEWKSEGRKFHPAIQKALDFIEHNMSHPIKLADIALAANCSAATLNRLFNQYLEISPGAWLADLRMKFATQLLEKGGMRIKEIAAVVGFKDPLNFSTAFRKKHGYSPNQYRAKQ